MNARSSTHVVVVKSENRGIRVVVGCLALFLWACWWWTGSLAGIVAIFIPVARVKAGEFGSVTGTLLPIFIDLMWFLGSVLITVLSWGKGLIWDVVLGIFETIGMYSKRRAAENAATDAAVDSATISAAEAAGDAAGEASGYKPRPISREPRSFDLDKVGAVVIDHEAKLGQVRSELEVTGKLLSGFNDRILALENSSATRLAPAKRKRSAA